VAIWGSLVFALVAGAMIPFQAGINVQLAGWVGGSLRAALISFFVGTAALFLLALLATRGLPSIARASAAPWWVWVGGLLGAFYVFGSIVTAPRLGAVVLVAAVVAGQSLASVLIDHNGWVGFDERAVTPGRIAGLLLLGAGVALVRVF
jgi:bacterial/archaeal transporter family-2 protein